MTVEGLTDPSAPWLRPFRADLVSQSGAVDWIQTFNRQAHVSGIVNARGQAIRFVAQTALPHHEAYESFVDRTGCVPTRGNPHDFFNALIWLHLPRVKAWLNARQAGEIEAAGVRDTRGAVRDFCTVFDENALLMMAPQADIDALRNRDWQRLLVARRSAWHQEIRVLIFGHALLEKLCTPYKAITAHVFAVPTPNIHAHFSFAETRRRLFRAGFQAEMLENPHKHLLEHGEFALAGARRSRGDRQCLSNSRVHLGICEYADQLFADALHDCAKPATALFSPMPVLGIPGWCAANQDPRFYDDVRVFRRP